MPKPPEIRTQIFRGLIGTALVVATGLFLAMGWEILAADRTNIHPPVYSQGIPPPYEPERIIRTYVHDYLDSGPRVEHETSGRYTVFGIPMKYTSPGEVFDEKVPINFYLTVLWEQQADGSFVMAPARNERGAVPRSYAGSNRSTISISAFGSTSHTTLERYILAAKSSGAEFDGYKSGSRATANYYWLKDTYCGYEMFETDNGRDWHRLAQSFAVPPPEMVPEPFRRARVFGLPNNSGGYSHILRCIDSARVGEGICVINENFNDYVITQYEFDWGMLCDVPELMELGRAFLQESIVEQR